MSKKSKKSKKRARQDPLKNWHASPENSITIHSNGDVIIGPLSPGDWLIVRKG